MQDTHVRAAFETAIEISRAGTQDGKKSGDKATEGACFPPEDEEIDEVERKEGRNEV